MQKKIYEFLDREPTVTDLFISGILVVIVSIFIFNLL